LAELALHDTYVRATAVQNPHLKDRAVFEKIAHEDGALGSTYWAHERLKELQ
jgi:hypothetical protein